MRREPIQFSAYQLGTLPLYHFCHVLPAVAGSLAVVGDPAAADDHAISGVRALTLVLAVAF